MASRNLEYSSDNLGFENAVEIVRREIMENSSFNTEVTGQNSNSSRTIKSSMNVGNVIRLDGIIKVELKGQEMVIDAVQEALDSQANETGQKLPRGGRPEPDLGGTGPDEMEFTPADPPEMPQPGEDIEDETEYYVTVGPDFDVNIETAQEGEFFDTPRDTAELGPFDTRTTAMDMRKITQRNIQNRDAEEMKDVLEQRFWVHADDEPALVDVLTKGDERGKAEMPLGLAQEAEDFGYARIVEKNAPDVRSIAPSRRPNYITPRYLEEWSEIFNQLQPHPGDEPRVPSPMDEEQVPQSQAQQESRMNVAQYSDPQAIAEIYENGVVSLNRDGSVDTLDTSAGIFIDRQSNSVTMGYMAEFLDLDSDEIDQIVQNVRTFLENNNG